MCVCLYVCVYVCMCMNVCMNSCSTPRFYFGLQFRVYGIVFRVYLKLKGKLNLPAALANLADKKQKI